MLNKWRYMLYGFPDRWDQAFAVISVLAQAFIVFVMDVEPARALLAPLTGWSVYLSIRLPERIRKAQEDEERR